MRSLLLLALMVSCGTAWVFPTSLTSSSRCSPHPSTSRLAAKNVEETTKKYGLEAGLLESIQQKDSGESAKTLLKKYGIAYLATSIPLALISMAFFYVLVDQGVDVSSLLAKVGIDNAATEKAGTFAIAYAAHKAASPIRFPPTVLLTPLVAKWIGKEPPSETESDKESL